MKLLVLSNCPLVESQGSGYVIVNFARGLQARGHEVELLGPESLAVFQFLRKAKSHRISVGMLFHAIRRLFRNHYDVVELYGGESWLAAWFLYLLPFRRFLLISHSNGIEPYRREWLEKYLPNAMSWDGSPLKWYQKLVHPPVERAFTMVDGIVTVSQCERSYAIAKAYQSTEHIVSLENSLPENYHGVEVDFERPAVIGFCGSWLPHKGIEIIKADLAKLLEEFPECQLKLVGVGGDFRKESVFPASLCSRIEVVPFVETKEELRHVYQSISILIQPSIYESFGLVAAEAMACGCALVSSNTGFAASLRDREEVLLMEEPASPFLYQRVCELLLDEPLRREIARGGYIRVQSLRWPNALDELESTYRSWLREFRGEQTACA